MNEGGYAVCTVDGDNVGRIYSMYPVCHCEAVDRGNLLRICANRYCLPGDCHVGLWPPRNDVVALTWSFYWWCGNGHPWRGGPTGYTVGNAVPGVPQNARKQPPHPRRIRTPSPFMVGNRFTTKTATVSRETVAVFSQSPIGSGGPGYLRNVNKN